MTGPHKVPQNGHPLVVALFRFLEEREMSVSELARKAGLGRATPRRWAFVSPSIANFDAVLNVLGMELCIRPRQGKPSCK